MLDEADKLLDDSNLQAITIGILARVASCKARAFKVHLSDKFSLLPLGRAMHLIQILLPLNDDNGRQFPAQKYQRLAHELTEKFGGATSFMRSPAEGRWKSGQQTESDDIAVIEVMAETVDHDWWAALRRRLEREFNQDEVVIRSQRTERL